LPYGSSLHPSKAAGLTATRDDVEDLAVAAYSALTGKTHSDYLDEYE